MFTVAVVGSGGTGPQAWDVGPRVVARLIGDRLTGGQSVADHAPAAGEQIAGGPVQAGPGGAGPATGEQKRAAGTSLTGVGTAGTGVGDDLADSEMVGVEVPGIPGVRLLVSTDLPVRLFSADSGLDELIMVESTHEGGVPGAIRQSVMETHGSSVPDPATGAAGLFGLLTSLHLPPRVVVFSVEAGAEGVDAPVDAADTAVDDVVRMVLAELRRLDPRSTSAEH